MDDDYLDQLEAGLVRLKAGVCASSDLEVAAADAIAKLRADLAAEKESKKYFMDLASQHRGELEAQLTQARADLAAITKERDEARAATIEECARYLDGIHHNSTAELLRRALAQPQDGEG